jgi:hypothetical protein
VLASGQRRTIHQCSHIRNAQIIRSHLFVAFRATHLRVFSFVYNVGQHYFVCIAAVWTLSPLFHPFARPRYPGPSPPAYRCAPATRQHRAASNAQGQRARRGHSVPQYSSGRVSIATIVRDRMSRLQKMRRVVTNRIRCANSSATGHYDHVQSGIGTDAQKKTERNSSCAI